MKLGTNSTHTYYATSLPNVGELRCVKRVHNRTGAVSYKVEFYQKTFKTLRGLERYAEKLRYNLGL
jgi:hypothetical protein